MAEACTSKTQCKVCEKDCTVSTIFKHVSHSKSCKAEYSDEEIQAFKKSKKQRDLDFKNRKYEPSKRRARYLEQRKQSTNNLKAGKILLPAVTTRCKRCNVVFEKSTILKHIVHSKSCKVLYSKEEIQSFRNWTRERKQEKRKGSYNSSRRRASYQLNKARIAKNYHETFGKFIEKPMDRYSLKGRSFAKIYDKAFEMSHYEGRPESDYP